MPKTPDYRVVHANLADMAQVTTAMTYQKGSWVLHMLRAAHRRRPVLGRHPRLLRARIGSQRHHRRFPAGDGAGLGRDLAPFFQQWLYRGGVPRLAGTLAVGWRGAGRW